MVLYDHSMAWPAKECDIRYHVSKDQTPIKCQSHTLKATNNVTIAVFIKQRSNEQ